MAYPNGTNGSRQSSDWLKIIITGGLTIGIAWSGAMWNSSQVVRKETAENERQTLTHFGKIESAIVELRNEIRHIQEDYNELKIYYRHCISINPTGPGYECLDERFAFDNKMNQSNRPLPNPATYQQH